MMFRSPKNLPITAEGKPDISSLKLFDKEDLQSEDTVNLAELLIGTYLVSHFDQELTGGRIVETEAYKAPEDKASHAHLNRYTERTKVMFEEAGTAYIYLCYGIHHLFNIVTGPKGKAHAVLIRAVEPVWGLETMKERRGLDDKRSLTNGPGKLSEALGIHKEYTGSSIIKPDSRIQLYHSHKEDKPEVVSATRIGIDYAEESKDWPWRYYDKQSKFVSRR